MLSSPALRVPIITVAVLLASASAARAGMPSISLTDLTKPRLDAISFFLVVFLVCTLLIRAIWNGLRADFPRWPRLSFGRASMLVGIWGLVFLLVLTMISGARELMTPGAWKKQGLTYKLADAEPPPTHPDQPRRLALDRLRAALWRYAEGHDGRFPEESKAAEIPEEIWQVPDPSGLRYLYIPGQSVDVGSSPLAYEPGLYGPDRLVLFVNGAVKRLSIDEIRRLLPGGGR
ncbi:hypothetical protein P12x_002470 [Tundrisphaera lichenicola]|uniref:hypothetical protein n=1 Tax=Tundrisphaera lichenicola TaxID=2029860 RepID=UPI003EBCC940